MWKSSDRAWRSGRSYHHEPGPIKGIAKDTEIIGVAMPVLDVTLNRGKRIGVPPPAEAALDAGHALPAPPRYRRPGIVIAAAALIAEVGVTLSGPAEPGTAPGGTTRMSTSRSASFSLIATGFWTPDPTAPPVAAPPVAAPPAAAPPAAPPPVALPPPPPRPELVLRQDIPSMAAVVSITNNANKPAVNCAYRAVAVAGPAAAVNYDHTDNFTVTGSAETRIGYHGPATGSTFHNTVTCDNGLSTSQDAVY
jgi:hypothetical protein